MKNFFVKGIAAAFIASCAIFTTSANAADLGGPSYKGSMKDGYDYKPAAVWTGFYLGVHGGGSWGDVEVDGNKLFEIDGGLIGIHGGYNYQTGNVVLGVEADYSFSFAEGDYRGITYEGGDLASVRARLGYTWGNTMLFGTGGVAWAVSHDDLRRDSDTTTGYVFGGGIEHKFTQNLSGRLEVLHYEFEEDDVEYDPTVVRAGLTWHLN